MLYFSLRTKTNQERNITRKTIAKLKELFGEENVETVDYDWWTSVEMSGDDFGGWVGIKDIGYNGKSRFRVFQKMGLKPDIGYDIPLEQIDTIYNM